MVAATATVCPKCGATGVAEPACKRCGLAVARMASFQASMTAPPALADAWQRATAEWDNQRHHDELLALAGRYDGYGWLAAQYRARSDDPTSTAAIARIQRAVELTLLASAAPRAADSRRAYRGILLIVVGVALASGVLYAALRLRNSHPDPTPPVVGPPNSQ